MRDLILAIINIATFLIGTYFAIKKEKKIKIKEKLSKYYIYRTIEKLMKKWK